MSPETNNHQEDSIDDNSKSSGVRLRRGPWSPEEDSKLLELVRLYGGEKNLNWVKISQVLQTRTAKQARERFHQNLNPSLNRTPITAEEGRYIEELVQKYGKRWAEIARHLNGRSDNAVKNWWNGGANRRKRASIQGLDMTSYEKQDVKQPAERQIEPAHSGDPILPLPKPSVNFNVGIFGSSSDETAPTSSPEFQAIRTGRSASMDMRAYNYDHLPPMRKRKLLDDYSTEPFRRHSAAGIALSGTPGGVALHHYNHTGHLSGNSSPYPASPMSKFSSRNSSIVSADCTPLTHLSDGTSINSRRSSMFANMEVAGNGGPQFKSPSLAPRMSSSGMSSPQLFTNANNSGHHLPSLPPLASLPVPPPKKDLFKKEFGFEKPASNSSAATPVTSQSSSSSDVKKDKQKMSISFLV
ncbi:hypothetical protein OGAPHI_004485 [Ogataea philodendri]|uniref:Uncharacterized protein n=1 Tax=Ogataea philodendri TaxID=1378263 RepID=A0A9P8P746_9ASCO|nr:uncharacterized protein OGAPHI_004485 [Ogataea philodendri]KAH3666296.1 hypothetical protein OGAPHI_004485 [Ogataea philodendri]